MENQVKLNLNIALPGRVPLSEQECSKNPKENYNHVVFSYETTAGKKSRKVIRKRVHLQLRKAVPASKSINLNREAYDSLFTHIPKGIKKKDWMKMKDEEKLTANLDELVSALGGTSYSYVVLDD